MGYKLAPTDLELAEMVKTLTRTMSPKLIVNNLFEMHRLASGNSQSFDVSADLLQTLHALVEFVSELPEDLG